MIIKLHIDKDNDWITNGLYPINEWFDAEVEVFKGSLYPFWDNEILFVIDLQRDSHIYHSAFKEKIVEFKNSEEKELLIEQYKKNKVIKDIIE